MKNVSFLVLDVDGTLTDGCVYMGENGELCKAFNIKDGYGIAHQLIPAGVKPVNCGQNAVNSDWVKSFTPYNAQKSGA